jgi:arylsulfatase/uncharacterized sulfatase
MSTTGDWDSYTPDEQRYQAKRMAVYAGMVDAMDHHLGRLVQHLRDIGEYDNTIFIFSSDNGAEASGGDNVRNPLMRLSLHMNDYTNDYDTLGEKGSFNSIGPSFASAAVGPLAYYKFYVGEGGMRVPLIISGESMPAKDQWTSAFAWVTDITPTILDMAGVNPPAGHYGGRAVEPVSGRSLLPLVRGEVERVYAETESIGYELMGNLALFQGDYKVVLNRPPVGDGRWHLYNIVKDPGETQDLGEAMPERLQQMLAQYQAYAADNGVLEVPASYNQAFQGISNAIRERFTPQILLVLLAFLTLLPFYIAYRLVGRKKA